MPTVLANVRDELKGMPWDPSFGFHVPWQSGATGLGYNVDLDGSRPDQAGRPVRSGVRGQGHAAERVRDTFPLIHLLLQARARRRSTSRRR